VAAPRERFFRVVERARYSNLKRFGSESLDSSLAREGSDDLATLICVECRYMLSVKTVRPRIRLIENACSWFVAGCTSSHASHSADRVLEPPLCRLLGCWGSSHPTAERGLLGADTCCGKLQMQGSNLLWLMTTFIRLLIGGELDWHYWL